jgi:signal transduction histidine kinase
MNNEIKVLVVDDDEEDFIIFRDIMAGIQHRKYAMEWSASYEEGLAAIDEKRHDVYLVDYRLGAKTGLELIEEAIARGYEAPFIILTGQNDLEVDTNAMQAGAADYLVKSTLTALSLERAIRYSMQQAQNMRQTRDLNIQLENRVRERTYVLEHAMNELEKSRAELSIALDREKEVNEMKSRFVSMASHEFRTPLATILSSLALISKYAAAGEHEKEKKHIERIKSSVHGLADLLNDFLSVSKLEEGKVYIVHELFQINELVAEVIEEMQTVTKPGQVLHYKHLGNTEVRLDKKIVKHILLNLISNAIKFSPSNAEVFVHTQVENDVLILRVEDSGIGISEDDQKHLFERFFRGKNVSNIQGTGLGLNIVNNYLKVLNGTIHLQSDLLKGSIFKVQLPLKSSETVPN